MHKRWISGVMLLAAALLITIAPSGCRKQTTVTDTEGKEMTLTVPETVTVNKGETEEFTITVERGGYVDAIDVEITGLPKGVKLVDEDIEISKGQKDVKVTIQADAKEAAVVANHAVKVQAKGGTVTATETIKLTVEED